MTKKVLFMLLLAIVTAVNVAAKATNYGIKIANMEVTSNNYSNITHKCITPYTEGVESYVRFDPPKKVLTFCNVEIIDKDNYTYPKTQLKNSNNNFNYSIFNLNKHK